MEFMVNISYVFDKSLNFTVMIISFTQFYHDFLLKKVKQIWIKNNLFS